MLGDGRGEIRQLASSFNTMAALAARDEDLRLQTDRLQGILDHHDVDLGQGRRRALHTRQRRVPAPAGRSEADTLGRTDDELFSDAIAATNRVSDIEVLRRRAEGVRARGRQAAYHVVKFPLKRADGSVYATATMAT